MKFTKKELIGLGLILTYLDNEKKDVPFRDLFSLEDLQFLTSRSKKYIKECLNELVANNKIQIAGNNKYSLAPIIND